MNLWAFVDLPPNYGDKFIIFKVKRNLSVTN